MNLGEWQIDDLLTFAVGTHDASTGAATDADAVPSYRIYEDETGTPILTGNMAKLDDANTTGFYSEQITLSAANGFEVGKSYTIHVSAAVDSVTGVTIYSFQVETAKATAAAIEALNDLSAAEVNAEVDAALAEYDGPTAAELSAGLLALQGADSDTLETLSDQMDGVLVNVQAQLVNVAAGGAVTLTRGTTWRQPITGLGDLSGYEKVYVTVKGSVDDPDAKAYLQVYNHPTTGLVRWNRGEPISAANGQVVIDDETAGDITVVVESEETISAPLRTQLVYDVKGVHSAGDDVVIARDVWTIVGDVTRAIT